MVRDVNGNPVEVSRWRRLTDRFGGGRKPNGELSVDESSLTITAECFDDSEAASTTLSASRWQQDEQAVLRHLLVVPVETAQTVIGVAAQDHYQPVSVDVPDSVRVGLGEQLVALARVQLVDALHVSQERSRMAGLAQRHGGTVIAWQVLQPPR